jgi:HicB family
MASLWCHHGAMDLRTYVEDIHNQLVVAAEAGGDEARALAERLVAPLDAAIRLALQDVLSAAAEEITCELAPGSVELRLRGRDPEFVVTPPPVDVAADDLPDSDRPRQPNGWPVAATGGATSASAEADEGAVSRINLRMPDQLKARIEQAAAGEGLSVNSWLVRAATASLEHTEPGRRRAPRVPKGAQRYTGWAR